MVSLAEASRNPAGEPGGREVDEGVGRGRGGEEGEGGVPAVASVKSLEGGCGAGDIA